MALMYFLVNEDGIVIAKSKKKIEGYLFSEDFPPPQALNLVRWNGTAFTPTQAFYDAIELSEVKRSLEKTDYKIIKELERQLIEKDKSFDREPLRKKIRELESKVPSNLSNVDSERLLDLGYKT